MSKAGKNEEMDYEALGIIPFDDKPTEYIMFRCRVCGYEEKVPDFVAYESYIPDEFAENGSPIVLCPKCEGDMIIKSDEV